jgi:hypothetical protein
VKIIPITILVLVLLSLVSCGGKTPIPTGPLPTHAEQAADDIVITPGGGSYRANMHEEGVVNPWPPVRVGLVTWSNDNKTVTVFYRTDIEAKSGEAYTDIIQVMTNSQLDREKNTLLLYAAEVPEGITVTDAAQPMGAFGALGTVLVITMSPDIAPGAYNVKIGIVLDGKEYGTVRCLVTVVE